MIFARVKNNFKFDQFYKNRQFFSKKFFSSQIWRVLGRFSRATITTQTTSRTPTRTTTISSSSNPRATTTTAAAVFRINVLLKILVRWAFFAAKFAFLLLGLTISKFVSTWGWGFQIWKFANFAKFQILFQKLFLVYYHTFCGF